MVEILDKSITEGKIWFEMNNNSNANIFSISNIMLIMVMFYSIATTSHILKKETYISIFFTLKGGKKEEGVRSCVRRCLAPANRTQSLVPEPRRRGGELRESSKLHVR